MHAQRSPPTTMLLSELLPTLDSERDWTECLATLPDVKDAAALLSCAELSRPDHLAAQSLVQGYLAADGETCASLLSREQKQEVSFTTNCAALDDLLGGGWRNGELIEVAGNRAVGKSLILLTTVMHRLRLDKTATALYIDTDGSFSAERAYDVLYRLAYPDRQPAVDASTPRTREAALDEVLSRLHVTRRSSVPAVAEALSSATAESERMNCRLNSIAIDTFSTLYKDKLSSVTSAQGHASLAALARHLRVMANSPTHPCLVLLANDSVSALPVAPLATFAGTTRKPALGLTWSHLIDWTLWISPAAEMGLQEPEMSEADRPARLIAVEVWRSRREPCATWAPVMIDGLALWDPRSA